MASIDMKSITLGAAAVAVAGVVGAKYYTSSVADEKIQAALKNSSQFADVKYDDVSVALLGGDVYIEDIVITQPNGKKAEIDEIVLHDFDDKNDIPEYLELSVNDIRLDVTPENFGASAAALKNLGYEEVEVSVNIAYTYDKASKEFELKQLKLNADDMGEATLQLTLEDVHLDNPMMVMMGMQKLKLKSGKLTFKDDSLLERNLKMAAKQKGKDVDEIVDEGVAILERDIAAAEKRGDDFSADAMEEVIAFLRDPDEISITASPEHPVSIDTMMRLGMQQDPSHLIKQLNLRVEAD